MENIDNIEKRRRGRPSVADPEKGMIGLRLSQKQMGWLKAEAEAQGVTYARIVKDLIDEAIERDEKRSARLSK